MRTTIRLEDGLLEQAKEEARRRKITLTALIEEGLRRELIRAQQAPARRVELPTFDLGGFMPGVDITNSASLWELLDEGVPLEKLR